MVGRPASNFPGSAADVKEPWFANGLRFECTRCGDCCRRPGDVRFERHEADRVAAHLLGAGATAVALAGELWLEDFDGTFRIVVEAAEACPFLGEQGCTIHGLKPRQCATYPFWDEILASPRAWTAESRDCEGMGRGPAYDAAAVLAARAGKRTS